MSIEPIVMMPVLYHYTGSGKAGLKTLGAVVTGVPDPKNPANVNLSIFLDGANSDDFKRWPAELGQVVVNRPSIPYSETPRDGHWTRHPAT